MRAQFISYCCYMYRGNEMPCQGSVWSLWYYHPTNWSGQTIWPLSWYHHTISNRRYWNSYPTCCRKTSNKHVFRSNVWLYNHITNDWLFITVNTNRNAKCLRLPFTVGSLHIKFLLVSLGLLVILPGHVAIGLWPEVRWEALSFQVHSQTGIRGR